MATSRRAIRVLHRDDYGLNMTLMQKQSSHLRRSKIKAMVDYQAEEQAFQDRQGKQAIQRICYG
jgi:hypothetical protein